MFFRIPDRKDYKYVSNKPKYLVLAIKFNNIFTLWYLRVKVSIKDARRRKNTKSMVSIAQLTCFSHDLKGVYITKKDGHLNAVTTKGGTTTGRAPQTYIHLLTNQPYHIEMPSSYHFEWCSVWDNLHADIKEGDTIKFSILKPEIVEKAHTEDSQCSAKSDLEVRDFESGSNNSTDSKRTREVSKNLKTSKPKRTCTRATQLHPPKGLQNTELPHNNIDAYIASMPALEGIAF